MSFFYAHKRKEVKHIPNEKPETLGEVLRINIQQLHPHPDNPYGIRDDSNMLELMESIKKFGVLCPAVARPRGDGDYELIAGHRRTEASRRAGLDFVPVIVLNLDDNDAIIQLVDSNIQRENILPSERAKAYKIRMEAVKRKAGRPPKEQETDEPKISAGFRSDDILRIVQSITVLLWNPVPAITIFLSNLRNKEFQIVTRTNCEVR